VAKTLRKILQMDKWLKEFPGQSILATEKKFLPSLLSEYYGSQVLLIGTPNQHELLRTSIIPNRMLLTPLPTKTLHTIRSIESDLHELPIASGSVDLVILPHILEYLDNPQHLLQEACRIVRPQGHIVICGFNPFSLWGIKKLFTRSNDVPWSANFIQSGLIKKWLRLADFKLVRQTATLFRPPTQFQTLFDQLEFLEWLGSKCYAPLGGVYVLVAQAKVIPLTPIKLRWKQKLADVRLPIMSIPRPTTRINTQ
jgi:SAM-dependent methyltransferase